MASKSKAYMSEVRTGPAWDGWGEVPRLASVLGRPDLDLADGALREAEMILAETEPGPRSMAYHDSASPAVRAIGAWRGIPVNLTAHEALAESLRSFVEGVQ